MVLNYFPGTAILTQDNTAITNMNVVVTFPNNGTQISIATTFEDLGPGIQFPLPGTEPITYGGNALQVSYLPTSTPGNWQVLVHLPYTAQAAYVGQSKIDVLELWTPDGLTRAKGPSSSSTSETIEATGTNDWKTNPNNATQNGQLPNASSYLIKVWSKHATSGAIISNLNQFIVNQNQSSGTNVNPVQGPWDFTYRIKQGATILIEQTNAGKSAKSDVVTRDNPIIAAGSNYTVEVMVKRSAESSGEVMTVPVTVVESNPGANPTVTITNSADGTPIQPGGTGQVNVNQAFAFNVAGGKANYNYNYRRNSTSAGTLTTNADGNGTKVDSINESGSFNVNIQDPATGVIFGLQLTVIATGGGGDPPQCPVGYHWDATQNRCIADSPGSGGNTNFLAQLTALFTNAPVIVGVIALALSLRKGK